MLSLKSDEPPVVPHAKTVKVLSSFLIKIVFVTL